MTTNERIAQEAIQKSCMEACRLKDESFKQLIEKTLKYMDCDAYTDSARVGFRAFAKQLNTFMDEENSKNQ